MDYIQESLIFHMTEDDMARFNARITEQQGDCLLFSGHADKDGYYRFWVQGKHLYAHRAAYLHANGTIPEEYAVDHLCRNRGCVNAQHLEAVPHVINYMRGRRPRTSPLFVPKPYCKRGHERSEANLYTAPSGHVQCRPCMEARNAANNAARAEARRILREGKVNA